MTFWGKCLERTQGAARRSYCSQEEPDLESTPSLLAEINLRPVNLGGRSPSRRLG